MGPERREPLKGKQKKNTNKGFSLIEILVAIGVLAILIVPLLTQLITAADITAKAKIKQKATLMGESLMEEIKAMDLSDLLDGTVGSAVNGYKVTEKEDGYVLTPQGDLANESLQASITITGDSAYGGVSINQLNANTDVLIYPDGSKEKELLTGTAANAVDRKYTISIVKSGDVYQVKVSCAYSVGGESKATTSFSSSSLNALSQIVFVSTAPVNTATFTDEITIENTALADVTFSYLQENSGSNLNLVGFFVNESASDPVMSVWMEESVKEGANPLYNNGTVPQALWSTGKGLLLSGGYSLYQISISIYQKTDFTSPVVTLTGTKESYIDVE